jgi:hypothetical protein
MHRLHNQNLAKNSIMHRLHNQNLAKLKQASLSCCNQSSEEHNTGAKPEEEGVGGGGNDFTSLRGQRRVHGHPGGRSDGTRV